MSGFGWGLLSALLWGTASLVSAQASRLLGSWVALAWVALIGLTVTLPVALAAGERSAATGSDWLWASIAGVGAIGGLLLAYAAMRRGQVSIVTPIIATDGAIAALMAVAAGESLAAISAGALVVITIGVVLASTARRRDAEERIAPRAVLLALGASVLFALSFFGAGRTEGLGAIWVASVARMVGVAAITIPVVLGGRLTLTRVAMPYVAAAGLLEIGGYIAYVTGAQGGVAIPAVLASQYAVVAILGGLVVFKERLSLAQGIGILLTMAGVGTLAAFQA